MMTRSTCLFLLIFCFANCFCQEAKHCAATHLVAENHGSIFTKKTDYRSVTERMVVNIPVVVHVVWSSAVENISDAQVQTQLDVLNEDFNASNSQIGSVPAIFQALVADVGFHFCLASKDPNGNSTTGIVRTQTNNTLGIGGTSAIHHTSQGGSDAWNTEKYLNIWVAKFAGNLGGTGTFPGEGPSDEQGVQVNYKQFGTIGTATNPPYNLGRTCTHEIGHFFNLEHVWGPNPNSCCTEDDGVADTPDSCEDYLNECPTGTTFSCIAPDMWMNFMNYTDDACMAMFSKGQKQRMLDALQSFRPGLMDSDGCQSVGTKDEVVKSEIILYRNPVEYQLEFEIKTGKTGEWKFEIVDAFGKSFFCDATIPNQRTSMDCSSFPSGIYFLITSQNEVRIVRRVLIL